MTDTRQDLAELCPIGFESAETPANHPARVAVTRFYREYPNSRRSDPYVAQEPIKKGAVCAIDFYDGGLWPITSLERAQMLVPQGIAPFDAERGEWVCLLVSNFGKRLDK